MRKPWVIFTSGCFDVLHEGHYSLLNYCKGIAYPGDIVVVGLNSDESVRKLKGNKRPFFNAKERRLALENLKSVDLVIEFDETNPQKILGKIKPNLYVKGGDYDIQMLSLDCIETPDTEIEIFPTKDGYSTSNIIDRMNTVVREEQLRFDFS